MQVIGTPDDDRLIHMAQILVLVSMTLALMQGHSGSVEQTKTKQRRMIWTSKQVISITFVTTVGHFFFTLP